MGRKKGPPAAGPGTRVPCACGGASAHWLTGERGSSSKAITSRIWFSSSSPMWPKRGMLEQAETAFEFHSLAQVYCTTSALLAA